MVGADRYLEELMRFSLEMFAACVAAMVNTQSGSHGLKFYRPDYEITKDIHCFYKVFLFEGYESII